MADAMAFGNFSVELPPPGENLGQRAFAQEIAADFAERFAGIEDIPVRVNPWEHGWKALEIAEAQKRLDGAWRSVDGLDILLPPFDDFPD